MNQQRDSTRAERPALNALLPSAALPGALPRRPAVLFIILISVAITLAYWNSWRGVWLLDDISSITENTGIQRLWPIESWLRWPETAMRPVVGLSLALNYALSGKEPWSYHLFNLGAHLLAALTLFGVLRRTLLSARLRARFAGAATPLAAAITLLWAVHPLQTQAVTYVIQRAEVLMGLFYLLTLYCFIRGAGAVQKSPWYAAAVLAALLGAGCKQVIATVPLMVFLYDCIFVSGSFKAALGLTASATPAGTPRQRAGLYAGLILSWGLLALLLITAPELKGAGFSLPSVRPLAYLYNQIPVLLYYLSLTVWPHPLVFDYAWAPVESWREILPAAAVILPLLSLSVWGLWRRAPVALCGAWFFLILAPTSSVLPINDLAVEHRLYLPLAGVIALAVLSFWRLVLLLPQVPAVIRVGVPAGVVVLLTAILGWRTFVRNQDYLNLVRMWETVVALREGNWRARWHLGTALVDAGRAQDALPHYQRAVTLEPQYGKAHDNLGHAYAELGRFTEAEFHFRLALRLEPDNGGAAHNLGMLLCKTGRPEEAEVAFRRALQLKGECAGEYDGLGQAASAAGKLAQAIEYYRHALELEPQHPQAHNNLGTVLARQERYDEAVQHFQLALAAKPNLVDAENNWGLVLSRQHQYAAALEHFQAALRINPAFLDARCNLASQLEEQGQLAAALEQYRAILRIDSQHALALKTLAWHLSTASEAQLRNGAEGLQYAQSAVKVTGGQDPLALDALSAALAEQQRFEEAQATAQKALLLAKAAGQTEISEAIKAHRAAYLRRQAWRE